MTHAHPVGASTVEVKCKRCKQPFRARVADRKRGWGKFCSKSCKAVVQTQLTGNAGPRGGGIRGVWDSHNDGGWWGVDEGPEGWDGHKS